MASIMSAYLYRSGGNEEASARRRVHLKAALLFRGKRINPCRLPERSLEICSTACHVLERAMGGIRC